MTMPRIRQVIFASAALLMAAQAVAEEAFELAGNPEQGKASYQLHCASCHGNQAAGDGPAARAFNPPPSDLTREGLSADHLFIATRDGGRAVGLTAVMPAFRHSLDDQAIHDVVAYIKSFDQ